MLPWRTLALKLSRTTKRIVAGPLPLAAVVMTIQLSEAVAVQTQPAPQSRSKLDWLPTAFISFAASDNVNTQLAGFCVTVKVAVPTVTVPVRRPGSGLASTV